MTEKTTLNVALLLKQYLLIYFFSNICRKFTVYIFISLKVITEKIEKFAINKEQG